MGVAIGRACWSYPGFGVFRRELAALEGISLDAMAGYGIEGIPWDTVENPLVPLLNHSDCTGRLSPEECAEVYPRLEMLIPQLSDQYDRDNATLLVAAMKQAIEDDEPLGFR
jgi:hypothetical protein